MWTGYEKVIRPFFRGRKDEHPRDLQTDIEGNGWGEREFGETEAPPKEDAGKGLHIAV